MRIFCVRGKTLLAVLAVILACALLAISVDGSTAAAVWFGYSQKKVPVYCVETEQKQVAITFDAAWGADKTEAILEILQEFDCTATFFLVGFWVDDYPEQALAVADAGMEIGTHSNTHPDMAKLDSATMKSELEVSISKIEALTGKNVQFFRAPYGSYNNTLLDVASGLGLTTIQWSVDSWDWMGLSASEIYTRIMDRVQNGSIILMHNNSDNVLDALRLVLSRLKVQGYSVTSVGELVATENYTIDRNGVQHKLTAEES